MFMSGVNGPGGTQPYRHSCMRFIEGGCGDEGCKCIGLYKNGKKVLWNDAMPLTSEDDSVVITPLECGGYDLSVRDRDAQTLSLQNVDIEAGTAEVCIDAFDYDTQTYVPGNCITIDFAPFVDEHETVTIINLVQSGPTSITLTYIDEDGVTNTFPLDLTTIVQNAETVTSISVAGSVITYIDEDGNSTTINIADLETTSTLVQNPNGSFTYTDEDGTVTVISGVPATANTVLTPGCDPVVTGASLVNGTLTINSQSDHTTLTFGGSTGTETLTDGQTSMIVTSVVTNPSACRPLRGFWTIRNGMTHKGGPNSVLGWNGEWDRNSGVFSPYHFATGESANSGVADWADSAYDTTGSIIAFAPGQTQTLRLQWYTNYSNPADSPETTGGINSWFVGSTV